jgi:hypothetical protein
LHEQIWGDKSSYAPNEAAYERYEDEDRGVHRKINFKQSKSIIELNLKLYSLDAKIAISEGDNLHDLVKQLGI